MSHKSSEGLTKVWSPTLRTKASRDAPSNGPDSCGPSTMHPTVLPASASSPIVAGTPKASLFLKVKDFVLNGIGNITPGEPKGVCAKPSGCTRRDKVVVPCWTGWISGAPETTSQPICSRYYFWVTSYPKPYWLKRIFLIRLSGSRTQESRQGIIGTACLRFVMSQVGRCNIWKYHTSGD